MTQTTISNTFEHGLHKQIIKVCHSLELPLHFNIKGPKLFTNYQRVALIILYKRSKKSLVDFVSELHESLWPRWLSLKEIPGKSTLHDWLKLFEMPIIRALHKAALPDNKPELMAIDATGIDSWQRSRHYERRIGQPYMPYAKLDVIIDVKTLIVYDHVLRLKPRHDVIGAKSIFQRTKLKSVKILGDKGYDSEPLHQLAIEKGNSLYAPVRKSPRTNPRGTNRRKCIQKDEQYQMRSTVESVFHALKQRILPNLRCKLHYMKKREMAWGIILFNMIRINEMIRSLLRILVAYSGCTQKQLNIIIQKFSMATGVTMITIYLNYVSKL